MSRNDKIDRLHNLESAALRCAETDRIDADAFRAAGDLQRAGWRLDSMAGHLLAAEAYEHFRSALQAGAPDTVTCTTCGTVTPDDDEHVAPSGNGLLCSCRRTLPFPE